MTMFSMVVILLAGVARLVAAAPIPGSIDTASLKHIANVSYADASLSGLASIFSPRMDFDQWRPLTGRGDPLHNDPTYDYEPPLLDRVHYWVDDSRLEREHYPERKYEVLMLGVSSRKPSAPPVPRPVPPRRHHRPPNHLAPKYEDYTYKFSDHYPMTFLVPPPPPPPGHKPSLFILNDKPTTPIQIKVTDPPKPVKETMSTPEHLTSLYALQEANLIYQSSTTSHNWLYDDNQTRPLSNNAVSSDYAGWGPTTPIDNVETANDTHNFIFNDQADFSKQPYSFYKPMLSEAPPPPRVTPNTLLLPTFVPTVLPPLPNLSAAPTTTVTASSPTYIPESTTSEPTHTYTNTFIFEDTEETTTEKTFANVFHTTPTSFPSSTSTNSLMDMMSQMMTMPLVNGPDRPEDHLYAHASENLHVYKEHETEDPAELETMQTMQPPPVTKDSTPTSHKQPFHVNTHVAHAILHKRPAMHTHDPYLNMRFTTPSPTVPISVPSSENIKPTTEDPAVPMYLIIQGHSKVKTYGSKPKPIDDKHTSDNEIPKPNETNEVRHLHPIKEKYSSQKSEKVDLRRGKAQSLRSLVDEGRGSIEIQETDLGIKYDVSDGREVPVEIYRKGIVDNDENNYSKLNKMTNEQKRTKRQASVPTSIDEVMPFDEDKLETYVYSYLEKKKNATGITGVLANTITGGIGTLFDDIDDDDSEEDADDDGDVDEDGDDYDDDDDDDDDRR